jgi:hypothetical protein
MRAFGAIGVFGMSLMRFLWLRLIWLYMLRSDNFVIDGVNLFRWWFVYLFDFRMIILWLG